MSAEEDWVKTAMSDDSVVITMLLHLHQAAPPTCKRSAAPVLQLEWSVRQLRSKQVPRKKGDTTRASPTTPLSWSGATSVSGNGTTDGGFEESSKAYKRIDNARSKVVATGETASSKRFRKKKASAELKEEESLLLKERRNLKNKLVTLRLSFKKQRAQNESLKGMKIDILSQRTTETVGVSASQEAVLNQHYQMKLHCDPSCMILPTNDAFNEVIPSPPTGSSQVQEGGSNGSSFLLPDLNLPLMMIQPSGIYME